MSKSKDMDVQFVLDYFKFALPKQMAGYDLITQGFWPEVRYNGKAFAEICTWKRDLISNLESITFLKERPRDFLVWFLYNSNGLKIRSIGYQAGFTSVHFENEILINFYPEAHAY